MRIGFIVNSLDIKDGAGRFAFELISNLKKQGHEVIVLDSFLKIFKNIDIIHAIDGWPNGFYASLLSLLKQKPVVITALGTYSVAPLYSVPKPLLLWAYRHAKALIAISDYTAQEINKVAPDVKIICPGIDLDFWSGKEARLPKSDPATAGRTSNSEVGLQYEKYKPYVLSVGALKPRKGYHNSIKAFAAVAKKNDHLNYVIIGQGEESDYAKELKKTIKENGLEKRVFFVGGGIDDKELLGFYRNAELFVLTPVEENHHFEGFGIVYLEAAASGLPIVATYKSGATSAISEGYNGLLVAQNDPEATANAILKILENPEFKTKLAENSREWVKEFSWVKIIADYNNIYSKI